MAKRIVSIVPSQTELLFDLGLDDEVVGITKFCIHPEAWFRNKTRVGGTKNLNLDKIRELRPDLILANREENTKEEVEILSQEFPTYISDIHNLKEAMDMILEVGQLCGREKQAQVMIRNIAQQNGELPQFKLRSALYLIWRNPFMAAGSDTFIHDMMQRSGFVNVVQSERYPELKADFISQLNPEVVLLSSEPYPFKEKHIDEIQSLWPEAEVRLVDGELFSWYGSRLLKSFDYFRALNESLR
ncbi:MAG: ABC transporter substrate-binding protein [Chitinophagaceae bacterium]|nr:ABC transporter substrate-binding protein [Chitinophagaceae bacterium]